MALAQDNSLTDLIKLIKGSSSSSSTKSNISKEGVDAMIQQILQSSQGLAAVSMGQKSSGMYNSTVNQQLTNDLTTRAAGEVAKLQAGTTTTQKTAPGVSGKDALTLMLAQGGKSLLGPSAKALAGKSGLDQLGNKLADALGLADSSGVPASIGTSAGLGEISLGDFAGLSVPDIATSASADILGSSLAESFGVGSGDVIASDIAASTAGDIGASAAADVGTEVATDALKDTATEGGAEAGAAAWVICTELHSQKLLETNLYLASALRALELSPQLMRGYHAWAIPVTKWMRKSPALSDILAPIAVARCKYLLGEFNLIGWATVALGEPMCSLIGAFIRTESTDKLENLYGRT
jgi:hypothetical protein